MGKLVLMSKNKKLYIKSHYLKLRFIQNIIAGFIGAFIGTKEDSAFYLKTLAAIATLVQQDGFEEKWLNAEDTHYLRDMVLLSERMRFSKGMNNLK